MCEIKLNLEATTPHDTFGVSEERIGQLASQIDNILENVSGDNEITRAIITCIELGNTIEEKLLISFMTALVLSS